MGKTTISRRRMLRPLAIAALPATALPAQTPADSLEALRHVAAAHGANLADERLRVLLPVLASRQPQLRRLRDLQVNDSVAPSYGHF